MKYVQSTSSKSLFDISDESNEYDDNNFYNAMASPQTQTLSAPDEAVQIGTIASPSFSPAVGVEFNQDLTDLMPMMNSLNKNVCSTSEISLKKSFIRSIGGRDGKEHITRSLTKLFNNEYAGK
eukprot:XP_016656402.1 PREDICTED: uncharacterized protein LOC107882508 [Acyrthosiphon pisum]